MRPLLLFALLLAGGAFVLAGPPAALDAAPPRPAPTLTGLGNPFPDVYPRGELDGKGPVHDLAVVDGRVYLAHGSTNSGVPNRPVYYDVEVEAWGVDDAVLHQEGIYSLEVGPSGRLYASADDAIGRPAVLMIRRERDGTWTERVADPTENHSRHTFEWADPATGDTLVLVQNGAPHFPDVSVSYDGGETFVQYGYEPPAEDVNPLRRYTFFPFQGALYATSFQPRDVPGYPEQKPRPYLIRYTGDRDQPFAVVLAERDDVFPGSGSQIDAVVELGDHLVVASGRFYAGTALERGHMKELAVPERARDLVRVGGVVYLLGSDIGAGTSALYETRDGETVREVARFDRPFVAVEHADGAFYLAESGAEAENTLWRYRPAP
ncbi:hypothetical protein RQM47_08295 [Rubrivirga sp. S365]|uniref:BNR repeat-containing family member n=1 Tax=Rubrivirga litoralis TaxID=3075598 RepID=A0ABU3BPN4_9BACT|nr:MULTISPECIES: hypothetical protein [unclassified Rubrivirga]MDT0631220.1 hypothetical protein [Rubrivirga sp. F394]MDT7856637.1 hypothetical protein [Rubrivirga sp. S365]